MATTSAAATPVAIARTAPRGTVRQRITPRLLPLFTVLAIIYLMIPIAVMIVFSFNTAGRQVQLRMARVLAQRLAAPVRLAGAPATRS